MTGTYRYTQSIEGNVNRYIFKVLSIDERNFSQEGQHTEQFTPKDKGPQLTGAFGRRVVVVGVVLLETRSAGGLAVKILGFGQNPQDHVHDKESKDQGKENVNGQIGRLVKPEGPEFGAKKEDNRRHGLTHGPAIGLEQKMHADLQVHQTGRTVIIVIITIVAVTVALLATAATEFLPALPTRLLGTMEVVMSDIRVTKLTRIIIIIIVVVVIHRSSRGTVVSLSLRVTAAPSIRQVTDIARGGARPPTAQGAVIIVVRR